MIGSITKKGNKYYGVYDTKRNSQGKRQQKWTKGYDKKSEAQKALTNAVNKINSGIYINSTKKTLAEYLIDWYNNYVVNNLQYNTTVGYRVNIYNHIIPEIGQIKLKDLQPYQIQKLYDKKRNEGLSATSIISIHRTLHKALYEAFKIEIISRNPSDNLSLPKKKKYHPEFLNEKEAKQVLDIFKDTNIYLPVLLGLGLGLRRGEVLGLRWQDVELENKTIHIRHSLTQRTGGILLKETKNESSRRSLIIPEIIADALKREKEKQKSNQENLSELYQYLDYVCCNDDGSFMSPSGLSTKFHKVILKNDFKQIRFHDLRHTNASMMLMNNTPIKVASDRLGHSSVSITLDIYTHTFQSAQKEAANTLDVLLAN